MITSRKLVKIIDEELNKDIHDEARVVLSRVRDKIEILEEIDYLSQYKQPVFDERSDAFKEAEKMFK